MMDAMIACKYCQRLQAVIYVNIVRFQGEQNPIRINKPENKIETLQNKFQLPA